MPPQGLGVLSVLTRPGVPPQVRAKEARRLQELLTRDALQEERLARLARLPAMARVLRSVFVAEKKPALSMELLCARLADSCPELGVPGRDLGGFGAGRRALTLVWGDPCGNESTEPSLGDPCGRRVLTPVWGDPCGRRALTPMWRDPCGNESAEPNVGGFLWE